MSSLYIVRVFEDNEVFEYEYGNLKHAKEHYETDKADKVELIEYIWDSIARRQIYNTIASRF